MTLIEIEHPCFIGKSLLRGVDHLSDRTNAANCMRIWLDDHVYTVVEDENDGYRSSMKHIIKERPESVFPLMTNVFTPIEVIGERVDSLVTLKNVFGGIVVQFGTDHTDDYYPTFIAHFSAEMADEGKKVKKSPPRVLKAPKIVTIKGWGVW